MYSNKQEYMLDSSQKSSSKSICDRKYNLVVDQPKINQRLKTENVLSKEQIEQQLLRAFDTQMSFGQKPSLPKGLLSKHHNKQKLRSISLNSANVHNKREPLQTHNIITNTQKLKLKHLSQKQLPPKAITQSHHPTHRTNRSKTSHTTSVKSFHHNKRQSITSQFLIKKQTQKLVQKLLTIKPSQQVSRQKQLESYYKHNKSKHIMMHRFDSLNNKLSNDKKGIVLVKKSNCCSQHQTIVVKNLNVNVKKRSQLQVKKLNAIELKEIQLRKMLKEEKRKNRLQLINKITKHNNVSLPNRKHHQRLKTLDAKLMTKRINNNKSEASDRSLTHLPKIRTFSKAESYQERSTFAISTPSVSSQYHYHQRERAPGHIKQRTKSYF